MKNYIKVTALLRAATQRPVWVKPDAGLPELDGGRVVYRLSPDEFAAKACELVKAGANVVGGCCGTGPAFIRAIVAALA